MSTRTTEKVWAGPVTAYALEVYYNGYTGTLTEWLQHLANTTDNAEACQRYAEAAEESAAVADQIPTMVSEALRQISAASAEELSAIAAAGTFWRTAVNTAGGTQVSAVNQAGTDQVAAVDAAGSLQVQAVADEGADQITAVGNAGTAQVTAVNQAGTAQVTAVNQAGSAQVQAVDDKGDEVIASIPADYTQLQADIAPPYDATATYAVGDYVMYGGVLYVCTTAIETAEAWTAAHWTQTDVGTELTGLKSAIEDRIPKYGAAGFNNAGPALTRMYDAIDKTAQVGTDGDNSSVVNDFDNLAPFNRKKCVGHWEAGTDRAVFVVEAYEGDPDYAEDGTMGDYVAVDCPPAYVWESSDGDIRAVSPVKLNGFRPFACLASKDNPAVCREHTYLPVYPLALDENGHAVSLPGYSNRQGDYAGLLGAAKTYANADVQQYCHLMPDDVAFYEETLYDIEFATHHCQSVMYGCASLRHNADDRATIFDSTHWLINNFNAGRVVGEYVSIQPTNIDINNASYYASHKITGATRCDSSGSADNAGTYTLIEVEDLGLGRTYEAGVEYRIAARPYNTGACAGVSTPSGSPVSNSDGFHPMKYRHRENVFGNQFQTTMDLFALRVGEEGAYQLEWYKMLDVDAGTARNYSASDLENGNFTKLGYTTPTEDYKNGYITEEVFDRRYPDNRIPVVGGGGSASTHVCDYASLSYSHVIRSVRRFGYWFPGAHDGFGYRYANYAPESSNAYYGGGLYLTQ